MPTRTIAGGSQAILAAMREAGGVVDRVYAARRAAEQRPSISPCSWSIPPRTINSACLPPRCGTGRLRGYFSLNLNRITQIEPSPERYAGPLDVEAWRRSRRCAEPLQILVTDERNGIERFMVEFSSFEKQSEYDADTNACLVQALVPEGRRDRRC